MFLFDDVPKTLDLVCTRKADRDRNVVSQKLTSVREIHVARHEQMLSHFRRVISKNTGCT